MPLTDQERKAKPKYCSICASSGHLAQNCKSALRVLGRPVHSVFVQSYNDAYKNVPLPNPEANAVKYVILSSRIDNYKFNHGDEVKRDGNTMFGRFAKKFNLKEAIVAPEEPLAASVSDISDLPSKKTSRHVFFDESLETNTTLATEDSPNASLEVKDTEGAAVDLDTSERSEASVAESSESETAEKINVIASLQSSLDILNEIKDTNSDKDEEAAHQIDELKHLNQDLAQLRQIKNHFTSEKEDVLPDFIPLASTEPERFTETRSENGEAEIVKPEVKSDAQILLSSAHCKYLLTATSHAFLREQELSCHVTVRMEWKDYGNVMVVHGLYEDQLRFRTALSVFLERLDGMIKSRSEVQIPKNRLQLINYIVSQFRELDKLGVHPFIFYHKMRKNQSEKTKASAKREKMFRKFLNMSVFGQLGLHDGRRHVQDLQEQLQRLKSSSDVNISVRQRLKIREHLNYIFSDNENCDDYAALMKDVGKHMSKKLPLVQLDRNLIGLPVKVQKKTHPNQSGPTQPQERETRPQTTEDIKLNTSTEPTETGSEQPR